MATEVIRDNAVVTWHAWDLNGHERWERTVLPTPVIARWHPSRRPGVEDDNPCATCGAPIEPGRSKATVRCRGCRVRRDAERLARRTA